MSALSALSPRPSFTRMTIGRTFLAHSKKRIANADSPSERGWALRQPAQWRDACLCFASASNTRGGVVGKNMAQIVREANSAGIPMSLRTFKRHTAHLQAHGVVYQDEARPSVVDNGRHRQRPSTWILRLGERMPDGVRLSETATPRFRPDARQWCVMNGIDTRPAMQPDEPPF